MSAGRFVRGDRVVWRGDAGWGGFAGTVTAVPETGGIYEGTFDGADPPAGVWAVHRRDLRPERRDG